MIYYMSEERTLNWYSKETAGLEAWVWFYNVCFDWNEI